MWGVMLLKTKDRAFKDVLQVLLPLNKGKEAVGVKN